jgi:hypothetical protein
MSVILNNFKWLSDPENFIAFDIGSAVSTVMGVELG